MKEKKQYFKVIMSSAIGGAMEYYDFVIFILFAKIISEVFFSPHDSPFIALLATYAMFAIGYFVRPIGGIILAHFGDKYGRKKIFTLTIFLMAVPTFLIGLLPTYASIGVFAPLLILILRICQGLAVGGEIPGAATFVYEHMPKNKKSTGIATLVSGLVGGILIGSLIGALITHSLSNESLMSWGWRIPFLLGGLLGVIGIYIRSRLSESPAFKEIEKFKKQAKLPFEDILKQYKLPTIAGIFTTMFAASCITTFYMYLPSYLGKVYNYSYFKVLSLNTFGLIIFILSILLFPYFADKKNKCPKKLYRLSAIIVFIISIPFFVVFKYNNLSLIIIMYIILGIGFGPSLGFFVVLMTKSFPARVRFTGVAIAYNVSFAVFAGLTPIINTVIIKKFNTPIAPAYYAMLAALIGFIASFALKFVDEEE